LLIITNIGALSFILETARAKLFRQRHKLSEEVETKIHNENQKTKNKMDPTGEHFMSWIAFFVAESHSLRFIEENLAIAKCPVS
jgi:hypothetical protein